MSDPTPKAFDFGEAPAADAGAQPAVPKAFDFGDVHEVAPAPPKSAPKALFESEDHPAVRDAMATVRTDYPALFARAEPRLLALFRRILPVKLALVTDWAEAPLTEQAALLQPITDLVRTFSDMAVPALLEDALASCQAPTGLFDKLFSRSATPAQYKPKLVASRAQLQRLIADSDVASGKLEASAQELTLHALALTVVSQLLTGTMDATLLDVLLQRRTLIQQAVRQAELSILQMGQVRQQAADLIGQVSSFLSVTLPAIEMARTQNGD
ncbi:MAG: hypothetical protein V4484_04925 [Pseudomonadota bacterium]